MRCYKDPTLIQAQHIEWYTDTKYNMGYESGNKVPIRIRRLNFKFDSGVPEHQEHDKRKLLLRSISYLQLQPSKLG